MISQNTYKLPFADIHPGLLGTLDAPCIHEGEAIVNGVSLPAHVIEELRQLGRPLGWYHGGELQHIVNACAYDRNLIDDPDGVNLFDQMHLDHREAAADAHARGTGLHPRFKRTRHAYASCDRLEEERETCKEAAYSPYSLTM